METSLLKKGFWSNLILLSSLLIITLTFGYSKLPTNFKADKSTLASISSDKADYQPGDTLRLSGTGFMPGETVTLHFDETPTVCPNGHNRSTVADSNGNIFYNQFYFNINHVGVAFVVTATGQSSGIIAQTTFTDANTALTSPSPTTAVYGSTITISSTLTQQGGNAGCSLCVGNGNPIPNRTLAFSVNGGTSLGSGVTNSSGAASSTAVIALNVGAYNGGNGLKVNFAGDSTPYAAQSATVNFSVTKATSSISAVSGSGIYGASATLTATVNLNIAGIPINFSLDGTSVGSANTNASGVATLVVPFASIPSSVRGANTWAGKVVAGIANTANYSATNAAGNLVISKLDVTGAFTASNKIYNGDNSATVLTRFLNGVLAGDTSNVSLSGGTASFADANVGAAKVVTLVGAGLTGSAAGNYNLTSVSTTTANIAARPITVTADAKSKIYGDSDPAFTYQLSETLIAGNAFSGSLSRIAGENVGSYDITQGDLTLGSNYDLSYIGADLTIGQRTVEVTADAKSKTYGDSDPAFTYQITQGSLVFSDAFSGSLSRIAGENVGSYDITQGDLTLGSNYDLSFVGADLAIGQRAVEVTADAKSKTYGASDPAFNYQITQGSLAFSDAFSGNLSRVAGENVGSYDIIQGDLTLGSNYDLSFVGADLTIGQRAVEVTADAKSKTYGDSDPNFTYQITQGSLAFSDAFSGSLSRIAGENVGSYDITQGDLTLGSNYDLSFVGADLTIGQRAVEVTADAKSKTYGASDPAFTYQITQGSLAFSDAFSGSLSRIAGENVGSYDITQGDLTLGSNYDLSFVGADLAIGQRAVEVTADAKSKVFGDADPVLTYAITNGSLAFSDSFVGNLTRIAGEVIGSYAIQNGTLSLGGNYNLSYVGANLDIIGLPLTATVTKTDVTCNGLSNGSISISNLSGGLSGSYEYRLNSGLWQASGSFSNLSANTYSVQIRDAAHPGFIVVLCTKVINEPALLSANCTNTNNTLYFGYTGDQTSTITVNPSGGVGPYTVSIAMNRPLMCNVITNSGDEIWTPGANTMASNNTNVTCVTSGAFGASQSPSSTSTNTIIASLGYSLNVSLMADATFAITVTDQNGCTATCSTTIMAEDVRCFAGNSGVTKVMLCHKTGSAKNPCVSICVDNTAVAEHLAHGDFFGKCTSTCAPSGSNGKPEVVFDVKAYPNPSNNQFTFEIESESTESTDITVFDIAGRMVKQMRNRESDTITFGEELPRGVYLAVIEQGSNRKTVRIIKE